MTADEVLISSSKCGQILPSWDNETGATLDAIVYGSRLITASASYAQQCYDYNGAKQGCSEFVQKQLPRTVYRDVSCPFPGKDRICIRDNTNLRIDSGLIDSHAHLGINAASKDRFAYRHVVECAPLNTARYTRMSTHEAAGANSTFLQVQYGSTQFLNESYTVEWPLRVPLELREYYI